jgi:hypothetical protein
MDCKSNVPLDYNSPGLKNGGPAGIEIDPNKPCTSFETCYRILKHQWRPRPQVRRVGYGEEGMTRLAPLIAAIETAWE